MPGVCCVRLFVQDTNATCMLDAVELMQKSQYRPLERVRATTRFVSSMLPLISGRGFLRTGTGPMRSIFRYLTPAELNKFSIKPALRKLKVAAIAVGKACGLYRQAAIQNLIQKGGDEIHSCSVPEHVTPMILPLSNSASGCSAQK